jgi:hypothetical protein
VYFAKVPGKTQRTRLWGPWVVANKDEGGEKAA